jgi:putative acetyltransferase
MRSLIRPIAAGDVPAAVELVRDSLAEFGLTFGNGSPTDEEVRGLPASYADRGGAFFAAIDADSGALLGTAGVFPIERGVYELRKMYLRPEARGHGVGARLFDACLGFCRERGAERMVLDTLHAMTAAVAFYEKRGFVRDDSQIRSSRCSRGYRLDLKTLNAPAP